MIFFPVVSLLGFFNSFSFLFLFLVSFFSLHFLLSYGLWLELTVSLFALVCVDMDFFSTCILYTSLDTCFAATSLT